MTLLRLEPKLGADTKNGPTLQHWPGRIKFENSLASLSISFRARN